MIELKIKHSELHEISDEDSARIEIRQRWFNFREWEQRNPLESVIHQVKKCEVGSDHHRWKSSPRFYEILVRICRRYRCPMEKVVNVKVGKQNRARSDLIRECSDAGICNDEVARLLGVKKMSIYMNLYMAKRRQKQREERAA